MSNDAHLAFPGWEPPLENWSKLPHDLIRLMPDMNCAELKVTMYILRHTWGFGNYSKYVAMTFDEIQHGRKTREGRIDNGTGLSKQSVITGLNQGVTRGTLEVIVDTKDKARIKKSYKLRGQNIGQLESKNLTAGVQKFDLDQDKETLKDNQPSPKVKKERKKSLRATYNESMEKSFCTATGIPLPQRKTAGQKRSAGRLWNTPLWNIYNLFNVEESATVYDDDVLRQAENLIGTAVLKMRQDKLTISTPASIEKVAVSLFAEGSVVAQGASDDFWDKYK